MKLSGEARQRYLAKSKAFARFPEKAKPDSATSQKAKRLRGFPKRRSQTALPRKKQSVCEVSREGEARQRYLAKSKAFARFPEKGEARQQEEIEWNIFLRKTCLRD